MPSAFRRRPQPASQLSPPQPLSESDEEFVEEDAVEEEEDLIEETGLEDEEVEEDEGALASPEPSPALASSQPPPNYREMSTLASWTVSSSKPGCSIPQLRHPSTSFFWQSDGPQPHYLNIHFFKLVRIVGLRLYLDFEADESYTPTRIIFLAGSGMNDLVEWGEMRLETPRGWIWADFAGVGDPESSADDSDSASDSDDDSDDDGERGGRGGRGRNEATTAAHADLPPANNQGLGIQRAPLRDTLTSQDDASDFENAAPTPAPVAAPTAPTPATDPMLLDHPPHPATAPNATTHLATPSLPRPHPRTPFTPLSATTTPPQALPRRAKKQRTPVLRCHMVQIKILENHQNGKDTHLRGLQVFAKDNEGKAADELRRKRKINVVRAGRAEGAAGAAGGAEKRGVRGLTRSKWMADPVIR